MIVYRIAGLIYKAEDGIVVSERNVLKETPKTLVLENDWVINLKKAKLDVIEGGVYRDTFEMYTLELTQEKIEAVRLRMIECWTEKKQKAIKVLTSLSGGYRYTKFKEE